MKKSDNVPKRACGVLLPVFSLPSDYGIGAFSKEAYAFVDFLKKAGQKYWQILPLGPTGYGDSPYQSFSTFAGNPYLIDPEFFVEKGLLEKEDLEVLKSDEPSDQVDYKMIEAHKYELIRKAFGNIEKIPEASKIIIRQPPDRTRMMKRRKRKKQRQRKRIGKKPATQQKTKAKKKRKISVPRQALPEGRTDPPPERDSLIRPANMWIWIKTAVFTSRTLMPVIIRSAWKMWKDLKLPETMSRYW